MIHYIFTRQSVQTKLTAGIFGPYLPALITRLQQQQYARDTIQKYLHAADAFGHWVSARQLPLAAINEDTLTRYETSLPRRTVRSCPKGVRSHEVVGLPHLLHLLREQRLIAPTSLLSATTPTDELLAAYDQYLMRTHGAAVNTRRRYLSCARQFLHFTFASGSLAWEKLTAEAITAFVTQASGARQGAGRKQLASATRIFLRYLLTCGLIPAGLDAAIPRMRVWQHAALPEHLSPAEVARLLALCADGTALGKRNYALLLLLSRLGLRALEAAQLKLEDVDWRTGSLIIRASKTRRERHLPLPEDVGQALLDYLQQGRPLTQSRQIFLAHTAPFAPLQTSSALTKAVHHLLQKAGIERRLAGAHLLRHTAASQMVCGGASFKEVADVLGHQSLQTTGIYAKLDLAALVQVALPWPGGAQ